MESSYATEVSSPEARLKNVLIADDKDYWPRFMKETLSAEFPGIGRFTLLSKASEALSCALAEKPGLIVLDIEFKNEADTGINVAEKIWQQHKSALIIICSNHTAESYVRQLYQAMPEGASYGYIVKENIPTYLVKAVNTILEGDCFIDPEVQRVVQKLQHSEYNLTQGEFEALVCATLGYTDDTAGKLLHIGDRAMQARLRSVYSKFGIPDKNSADAGLLNPRARASWLALKRGMLTLADLKSWAEGFAEKSAACGISMDLR
ncbi:MAG TPA: response regulator [Planktothrix sp.]|jgi:DNA-binding NarL/FixJ family response regulator